MIDAEKRMELIAALATGGAWAVVFEIGQLYLDEYYPESVFVGGSGDSGPAYVVALREALKRVKE